MKDAVGGSLLLNMVVVFTSIVILFFVGILAYSKAFKIKNKIIEVVEKYETYDENVVSELSDELQRDGYIVATEDQIRNKCGNDSLSIEEGAGHLYCIYYDSTQEGYLYKVVTYTKFESPLIGDIFMIPVKGETKILGKKYDY